VDYVVRAVRMSRSPRDKAATQGEQSTGQQSTGQQSTGQQSTGQHSREQDA